MQEADKIAAQFENALRNSDAILNFTPDPPDPPQPSQAERTYRTMKEYVRLFQSRVGNEHAIGALLAPFGTFHIELIGYHNPDILTFEGVNENNEPVLLIQHVSQLSMQLVALKKISEEPRRGIGFVQS